MRKFTIVYLVFSSTLLFITKAEPKIVVLQNINGSEVIVSSLVTTINGTSFSLICKMIISEADAKTESLFDKRVIWSRKRRKSRFTNMDNFALMENNVPDASLSFSNVTLTDQGVYFCTSLKYKLLKALNLIVRPDFTLATAKKETSSLKYSPAKRKQASDSVRRVVRDVVLLSPTHYNYTGDFTPFTYTYPPIYEDYNKKSDHNTESAFRNDLPNWFYKDKVHDNSESLNANSSLLKFVYLMIGGVLLFIVIYVAVRCCHEDNNDTTPDSSNCQPRNRSTTNRNMCSHLVCIQNRSTHPFAECIIRTNDPRLLVRGDNNANLQTNHLDLPPTYDDSTANSAQYSKHGLHDTIQIANSVVDSCPLPPSYDEALSNAPNTIFNDHIQGCSALNANGAASTYVSGGIGSSDV